ncbi:Apl1 protein [Saccharomycopsis crataegensis]|uniref:AP complex subunit beta n=1 Tax=Saccharomycopsis crataegensis TaxID=43959 RepID=A0AAV5QKZ9_9ASCO|nr:Apl1 protein [Saccharomycopsis crataegensis]
MNDSRLFIKCKAIEIQNDIISQTNGSTTKKSAKSLKIKKQCMKRIVANVTMGNNEMINISPFVFQFYELDDLELKGMCCYYFSTYCHLFPEKYLANKDLFINDLRSTSSVIRSLAMKTICYFPIEEFQKDITVPYMRKLLSDPDSYVRKTTVFGIGKVFELNPSLIEESRLIEKLNSLLHDPSASVVSATVAVLDYIIETSPEMKLSIDEENVSSLVSLLPKASEFSQAYLLNAILSYVPQSNQESIDLISDLLPYLQHANIAVAINALKVIIYLSNYVKAPQDSISVLPQRLGNSLVSLLAKSPEIQFLVLRNVILLLLSKPNLIKLDVTMFFCQYHDPIYVKDTKLEIIYLLANYNNLEIVLRELEEYGTEADIQMSRKSIRAIGNLAIKLEDGAEKCTDVLVNLACSGIPFIIQETVIVMKNIYRKYPDKVDEHTIKIFVENSDAIEDAESKASFMWIIGTYCYLIPESLEVLKDFSHSFKDEPLDVQLTTLTTVIKFYLRCPTQGESLLLDILKVCTENLSDPDLRDRAYFYWKILSSQKKFPNAAQDIVLTELPIINSDQDKLDSSILEELELNIGTLASIYLKPVKSVFRLSRTRKLTDSPALQVEYNKSIKSSNLKDDMEDVQTKVLKIDIKSSIGTITSPKLSDNDSYERDPADGVLDRQTPQQRFTLLRKKSKDMLSRPSVSSRDVEKKEDTFDEYGLPQNSKTPNLGDKLKRRMTFTRKKSTMSLKNQARNFTS